MDPRDLDRSEIDSVSETVSSLVTIDHDNTFGHDILTLPDGESSHPRSGRITGRFRGGVFRLAWRGRRLASRTGAASNSFCSWIPTRTSGTVADHCTPLGIGLALAEGPGWICSRRA